MSVESDIADGAHASPENAFTTGLSFAQQRFFFLHKLNPDAALYNTPFAVQMTGSLDVSILKKCFEYLIRRHEILRTTYHLTNAGPVQAVGEPGAFHLISVNRREQTRGQHDSLQQLLSEYCRQPFDLSAGAPFRVVLLAEEGNRHILLVVMHHIIADDTSINILAKELFRVYRSYINGEELILPELTIQYADYAAWQQQHLNADTLAPHLVYWKEKLADSTMLELPTDYPFSASVERIGVSQKYILSETLSQKLKDLGRAESCSLFMVLLSAFKVLLYRYSNQNDIAIGIINSDRKQTETENVLGVFINTIVLRTIISEGHTFREYLALIKEAVLRGHAHRAAPFDQVVEHISPKRIEGRNPFFQVLFNMEAIPFKTQNIDGLEVEEFQLDFAPAILDLNLEIILKDNVIQCKYGYDANLFQEDTISRMHGHYAMLLQHIVRNANSEIRAINLLTTLEQYQLKEVFNNTATHFPNERTVVELFEGQVREIPDAIALTFTKQWSYRQLNETANQIANFLRAEYHIQPNDVIALLLKRTEWMPIGILATLKAGAAYLPLSEELPLSRLTYMIEDGNVKVILTDRASRELASQLSTEVVAIEDIQSGQFENPNTNLTPADLAYILYTSGTTGLPKGVLMPHQSMVNMLTWHKNASACGVGTRTSQYVDYSFDVSFQEIFVTWISGGELVLVDEEERRDLIAFADKIIQDQIERIFVPFVVLQQLAQILSERPTDLSFIKAIVTAGEQLKISQSIIELFKRIPLGVLKNHYGPAEAHVVSEYVLQGNPEKWPVLPPIGKPISNTELYILDKNRSIVPIGVTGELHIGGMCLSHGYLNKSTLTGEKFIAHPFKPNGKVYKTGDLCRWLNDGNIEFLGRVDHQLKIRGYRVEPGEIEQVLMSHPALKTAVVLSHKIRGEKQLTAYLVGKEERALPESEKLRSFLSETLPDYMLPSFYIEMEAIPLTINGKVDRRLLPEPDLNYVSSATEYTAPRSPVEQNLVEIWRDILSVERISIHDNFFALGGHSLRAIRVLAKIHQQLTVKLKLTELFAHPTIAELAQEISGLNALGSEFSSSIPPIPKADSYVLSNAQRRLWVIDQFEEEQIAYNMPAAFRLTGPLDYRSLETAVQLLFQRHESLRTNFISGKQIVHPHVDFRLVLHDFADKPTEVQQAIADYMSYAFDLADDVLLRIEVLKLRSDTHIILINIHHIISDGWSLAILYKEISILYAACKSGLHHPLKQLTPLLIQYKDYASWQNDLLKTGKLNHLKDYWLKQLSPSEDLLPMLELPLDYSRPAVKTYHGANSSYTLNPEVLQRLKELAQAEQATLFMCLTALINVLLYRYTGQSDIILGTPIAGRNHVDLHDQIGCYVNTLALRNHINAESSFIDFLKEVKTTTLEAFEHRLYPFDQLVEDLQLPRHTSRSAVFDVMLALQNNESAFFELDGVDMMPEPRTSVTSKFDIVYNFSEREDGLFLNVNYNTDLFKASSIDRSVQHLQILLSSVLENTDQPIQALNILPSKEKQQLLLEFNNTATDFPGDRTIVSLFEEKVLEQPSATALVSGNDVIQYNDLNARANQLAHYLKDVGVKPGSLVGICMDRSVELVVATLGILKAGAAYLPLDVDESPERLKMMLSDAEVRICMVQKSSVEDFSATTTKVVYLENERERIEQMSRANSEMALNAESLAYVMFTSGSTGQPKGVEVPHRAVCRLVKETDYVDLTSDDCIAHLSNPAFDAATFEIWGALLCGARLAITPPEIALSATGLEEFLKLHRVTTLFITTALFNQHVAAHPGIFASLKQVLFGGEKVDSDIVRLILENEPPARLLHVYGPTENTTFTTWELVEQLDSRGLTVPIGRPLANTQVYILDTQLSAVPIGVPGELYIGGAGLAHGYLNRPELTAEKFVTNPFSKDPDARLYRTGDLGRWLPNGSIEFIGRNDHQLKIRGHRIEPGEIESVLQQSAQIEQAVVIAREDIPGDKHLVAYLVLDQYEAPDYPALRSFLKQKLPGYMIPAAFVPMDTIPLTSRGKVDHSALPSPQQFRKGNASDFIAPGTSTEKRLAEIWKDVLWLENEVGIHDDFFDLGGHSLLAIQLITRIEETFDFKIPLYRLFKIGTIKEIADLLDTSADRHEKETGRENQEGKQLVLHPVFPRINRKLFALTTRYVSRFEDKFNVSIPLHRLFRVKHLNSNGHGSRTLHANNRSYVRNDHSVVVTPLETDIYRKLLTYTRGWRGVRTTPYSLMSGLNITGTRPPLFWCLQGFQEFYQLAKYLVEDQPVYGMRSGHKIMQYTQENIDNLARHYVNEILDVDPDGPYILGGNCQAGYIAYAIAQELTHRGKRIRHLFILESLYSHKTGQVEPVFLTQPQMCPMTFLYGDQSKFNPLLYHHEPASGLKKYLPLGFDFHVLPCDHGQYFREPNIQSMAGHIKSHIDRLISKANGETPSLKEENNSTELPGTNLYQAKISLESPVPEMAPDEKAQLKIKVENQSKQSWDSYEASGIELKNRWLNSEGQVIQWKDGQNKLNKKLAPGSNAEFDLIVTAPTEPGSYILEIDMVEDGITWFSLARSESLKVRVEI